MWAYLRWAEPPLRSVRTPALSQDLAYLTKLDWFLACLATLFVGRSGQYGLLDPTEHHPFRSQGGRVSSGVSRGQRLQLSILTQWDRLWPGVLVDGKAFQKVHPQRKPPQPLVRSRPHDRQLVGYLLDENPNHYY